MLNSDPNLPQFLLRNQRKHRIFMTRFMQRWLAVHFIQSKKNGTLRYAVFIQQFFIRILN
ncbi:hypothetical protein WH43_06430 [Rheinheimera sp. KL1]|nr:hypothetical protein WH43_06430 [Rheinheimera sp. KL1]